METRPYRFSTFAVPLSGNKGSASMLLGLMDGFRQSGMNVEWDVFSYYPETDSQLAAGMPGVRVHAGHPKDLAFRLLPAILLSKVRWPWLPKGVAEAISAIKCSDAVMLMGGTTFADSMLYKVPWNVLAALPAYWMRRPVYFLSQTIGPNQSALNRMASRWTLRRAREVHGRGRISFDHIEKLGMKNASYQPDLSFAMATPDFNDVVDTHPALRALAEAIRESGKPAVGIAPNSIVLSKCRKYGIDYLEHLSALVRAVADQGCFPVLIAHSYRTGVKQYHNNDHHLCLELMSRVGNTCPLHYVDADLDSRQLRSLIARLQLLVASRFHSMISALSQTVPPLTFGWGDQKYVEVLKEFNCEGLFHNFADLPKLDLPGILKETLDARDIHADRIKAALPGVVEHSLQLPSRIRESLQKY